MTMLFSTRNRENLVSTTQSVHELGSCRADSVGKKINDKLWNWYDGGYLPRAPRIPRDQISVVRPVMQLRSE